MFYAVHLRELHENWFETEARCRWCRYFEGKDLHNYLILRVSTLRFTQSASENHMETGLKPKQCAGGEGTLKVRIRVITLLCMSLLYFYAVRL